MKTRKAILVVGLLAFIIGDAAAQYYGPPGPPPGPAPMRRQRQQEPKDDEQSKPTGYFEISFGLAEPIGAFGATTGTTYGGYALPGSAFNLSLGIPVNHTNLGVALMYGDYNNLFDINSFAYTQQLADQSKAYAPILQDSYNESFILAGLFWTWPVHRLSFDARLMGGIAICHLPEVTWGAQGAYDPTISTYDTYQWDTYPSSSVGFAYDIGADIRYKLRRTSIMLGIDYTGANPNVNTTQQYTDPYGNMYYSRISGGVPMSLICVNLGLAYEIR